MRIGQVLVIGLLCAGASACITDPDNISRWPGPTSQTAGIEPIDPYHRDEVPDTPYEVRKGEIERNDHLAGRTGPSYPPLFRDQKEDEDGTP